MTALFPQRLDRALLLVGHGSRSGGAVAEFEQLVQAMADRHPEMAVCHGYVELARPPLDEALDEAASRADSVVVVPAFLLAAGHVKNDIPLAVSRARARHPSVTFCVARPLGVVQEMAQVAYERAADAGCFPEQGLEATTLLVVGRGSSDPDANGDMLKLARLMSEGRGLARVEVAFLGITTPDVPEALSWIGRCRPRRIVIIPYLLFAGRLVERLRDQAAFFAERHPWVSVRVAPHLGLDDRVLSVIDVAIADALHGSHPLACDSCKYRVPLPGRAEEVGGLRALMWSVRHMVTHSQAAPHEHAHKGLRHHLLVCTNVDCAGRGSVPLAGRLRRLVREAGLQREVRVTRTSCMGRCGEGPAVAVYPDGIWYRGVTESDAEELLREHIVSDRLVARLVDDVMQ